MREVQSETAPEYGMKSSDEETIQAAIAILASRMNKNDVLASPADTRRFLRLELATEKDEHFSVLYLDNRHRMIEFVRHFTGTIDGTSVHPRAIVRKALELNAAAIICSHNHTSGMSEPSQADRSLTRRLQEAMALIDVRMLDHVVVGLGEDTSFAERGWL